jgi:hypothetical protein
MNLFRSKQPVNEYETQTEIISTRIYLVALVVTLVVLVIYTSQILVLRVIIIPSPSYAKYTNLYKNYPKSLSCYCENIAIHYDQFMYVEARFRQVCQSNFVSDIYFLYISRTKLQTFVEIGHKHFQLIASWCHLANWSVGNGRAASGATQFTTNEILHIDLFEKQVQSLIHLFATSTTNTFVRTLFIVRDITHINALFTAFGTNAYPIVYGVFPSLALYISVPIYSEGDCSCVVYRLKRVTRHFFWKY